MVKVRRPSVAIWIFCVSIALSALIIGVVTLVLSAHGRMDPGALAGTWSLQGKNTELTFELSEDGEFRSNEWPLSLGCSTSGWSESVDTVTWNERISVEGRWEIGRFDSSQVIVTPTPRECGGWSLRMSPVLGDSSLRLYLHPEDPVEELVFEKR